MRYLLGTNFISDLRKGGRANRGVQAWAMGNDPALCSLSVVTLAEIRKGIEDKRRTDSRQAHAVEQWLVAIRHEYAANILPITTDIADRWGCLANLPRALLCCLRCRCSWCFYTIHGL